MGEGEEGGEGGGVEEGIWRDKDLLIEKLFVENKALQGKVDKLKKKNQAYKQARTRWIMIFALVLGCVMYVISFRGA